MGIETQQAFDGFGNPRSAAAGGGYHPAVLVAKLAAAYEMPPYARPIDGNSHGKKGGACLTGEANLAQRRIDHKAILGSFPGGRKGAKGFLHHASAETNRSRSSRSMASGSSLLYITRFRR